MIHVKPFDENYAEKSKAKKTRARKVDLIVLPEKIKGTNCGNCEYFDSATKWCNHSQVTQNVTDRMCCALWDAPGTKRKWKE